ncbi:hypothetical protein HG535_0F01530 [Zygotorulaspora mrakii]|uniref:Uncharacterized protein n=1 Tax=Zygotorulaspora mrakii TaxID=42260 RepID=A0A7H9B7E1_ZYGMR|nr:uncharacterized protein HG535_0F01530 [Zygotorulaspora mrakii]QLG73642.1 hypothetical protein HG535_0F01530 [Zygotorulaspora mrakii]
MQALVVVDFCLLIVLLCIPASCDVQIIEPTVGLKFDVSKGSTDIRIKWAVTENDIREEDISCYIFTLMSGPNTNIQVMSSLGTLSASDVKGMEYVFNIKNTVGSNGDYYVQLLAQANDGYSIHYCNRFSLTGMVGENKASSSGEREPPQPELRMNTMDAPIEVDSASFSVPYHLQNGRAKYAPMQQQPLTKITAVSWRRIHETSALTFYSVVRPSPDKVTTITPGVSYVLSTGPNWATAAPMPRANGHWYHPRKKLSLKPRKIIF